MEIIIGEYMIKKFLKLKAECDDYLAIIEEDLPDTGFYLYLWKNGVGLADYLQDTLDICKEQAFEEFGIPKNSWVEIIE